MVDFERDETQELMVATAREFGEKVVQPAEIELDRMADPADVAGSDLFRDVIRKAYELGFNKMALPEEYGGLGLDAITAGMVWEELSRYGTGIAATLIPSSIVPQLVAFLAPHNRELVERYVIPFCEDTRAEQLSAWASSEPDVGSDGKNYYDLNVHHRTSARGGGGSYVIDGTKSDFVSNGGIASVYMVFACVDPSQGIRGSGAFVVPGDSPGLSRGKALDKIGMRALNQAAVYFEGVEIPEEYMIFPPGENYPMLHNAIVTVGNLGVGYLAVGLMRAAYEEALSYSKQRVQWGKPIFEHQLVAAKLLDAFISIESARAFLQKGSWLSKTSFPGDLKTSLSAKIYATDRAVRVTSEMVQVLGGYGISKDHPLEKHMRDAKLLQIMDGTNETLTTKAAALL
ncbi:MAG: acyl-CoA dehydrogenase family protein [Actinomycetota bacterium]